MYSLPKTGLWTGRVDHTSNPDNFRFHQVVRCINSEEELSGAAGFTVIGFECEEGVRRNKGQLGAAKAPDEIRKALANLPYNLKGSPATFDIGNVVCVGEELEQAQQKLGDQVENILQHALTPIILGGGHETLYGHYRGVRQHIGPDVKLGLINIDAHFDMREAEQPSSGTMFRQILENDANAGYLVLGIQPFGNTKALFNKANELGCRYLLAETLSSQVMPETQQVIDNFCQQHDYVLLTLCTDSINASAAPGVSAPAPLGLDPLLVRQLLRYIAAKEQMLSFDISEVNPELDEQGRTVKLAAYLVADVIDSFNEAVFKKGVE